MVMRFDCIPVILPNSHRILVQRSFNPRNGKLALFSHLCIFLVTLIGIRDWNQNRIGYYRQFLGRNPN